MNLRIRGLRRGSRFFVAAALTVGLTLAPFASQPVLANPALQEFALPTADAHPVDIAMGSDGNMWFTEQAANQIGRITTSGVITEYVIPTADAEPTAITAGPDGAVWFVESAAHQLGRIATDGTITEYPLSVGASPTAIVAGPDGNVWFTDADANTVSSVTPTGTVTDYVLPTANAAPHGITLGGDGNLWFTERQAGQVGSITPGGVISEYPLANAAALPTAITTDLDGHLWFTAPGSASIGNIALLDGPEITEYPLADPAALPYDIMGGFDNGIWFTDQSGQGHIGRMTKQGVPWQGSLPTANASPQGITARNDDGSVWLVESDSNQILRTNFTEPRITNEVFEFTVQAGDTFDLPITTSGTPAPSISLYYGDLPAGLTLTDNGDGTGSISGTLTTAGVYAANIMVSSPGGEADWQFNFEVTEPTVE